jgi:hypothetical protein
VDVLVTPSSERDVYRLTDRLGRTAATIEKIPDLGFMIRPEPGGVLNGMTARTVTSLRGAMSAIERYNERRVPARE